MRTPGTCISYRRRMGLMDQMFVRAKVAESKEAMLVRNQQRPAFDLIESLVEQETWRRLSGHQTFIEASTSVPKDVAKLWIFIRDALGRGGVQMYRFSAEDKDHGFSDGKAVTGGIQPPVRPAS